MLSEEIDYEPVYQIGHTISESMHSMVQVERIMETLPGLDCAMCGCPTCRTMAEDIVRHGESNRCPFLDPQKGGLFHDS